MGLMYGGLSVSFKSGPGYSNEQLPHDICMELHFPTCKMCRADEDHTAQEGSHREEEWECLYCTRDNAWYDIRFSWFSSTGPHYFTLA